MKITFYTLVLALFCLQANAQINFIDDDTLPALLAHDPVIDTDNDGQISEAEAAVVTILNIEAQFIGLFPEVSFFTDLEELYINRNFLEALDVSQNANLRIIDASPLNDIVDLTLAQDNIYEFLDFQGNLIEGVVNLGNNTSVLEFADFGSNPITGFVFGDIAEVIDMDLTTDLDDNFNTGGIQKLSGTLIVKSPNLNNYDFCNLTQAGSNATIDLRFAGCGGSSTVINYNVNPGLGIEILTTTGQPDIDPMFFGFDCSGEPLSVGDNILADFSIYPNPTTGQIFFRNLLTEDIQFFLYDITGKLVDKGTDSNGLDLSNKTSGIYILQITDTQTGASNSTRIIKN